MKKLGIIFAFAVCLLLSIGVAQASAATYYVSPSGNDSNSGANDSPWRTFARAFDTTKSVRIKAGDTLLAKDGTYDEVVAKIPSGDSWSNPVIVKSQNPRKAIIRPSSFVSEALSINYGQGGNIPRRFITVEGFVWDCVYATNRCMHIAGALDESITDVRDIRIINNEVKNAGEAKRASYTGDMYGAGTQGILNTRADYVEYIGNEIHHNGVTDFDHGIYQGGGNNILMERNIIHNNRGSGLKIGWTSPTADNVARNNLIYDNNTAWTFGYEFGKKRQGRCISTHDSKRTKIYNNVCIGAHISGIDVIYEPIDAEVYNNTIIVTGSNPIARGITVGGATGSNSIIVKNTVVKNNIVYQANTLAPSQANSAIQIGVASSNTTVQNNMVFGTNTNVAVETTYPYTLSNTLVQDPQFVNLSGRDFHLKSTSPAINAGATISLFKNDFSYAVRPQGSAYDLGAYEFGVGATPATAAPTTVPTSPPQVTVTPVSTPVATQVGKVGDANRDNKVDQADYTIWAQEFIQKKETTSDFNKDGKVDGVDFTLWLMNYGK